MSLVNKILNAAMNSDQHVFVSYSPHVNWITVDAYPRDTDYSKDPKEWKRIFEATVELDSERSDERLAELLERVEGL